MNMIFTHSICSLVSELEFFRTASLALVNYFSEKKKAPGSRHGDVSGARDAATSLTRPL